MRKPASKLSSAIHPPSDPLAGKVLTDRFRELAARFDQWTADAESGTLPDTYLDFIDRQSADEDAGRLIMCAFHGGHLRDIPRLAELVNWAEGEDDPAATGLLRCPANLFGEVVGGGKILIRNTSGRTIKGGTMVSLDPQVMADEPLGGLLSEMFPGFDEPDRNLKRSLTAHPEDRGWFLLKGKAVGFRRRARACRLLADMIAQGPPAPAVRWQAVQDELLKLAQQGAPYTSCAKLAVRLKCAPGTIHKAVKRSAELRAWRAGKTRASLKAQSLNERVTDSERSDDPDPADVMPDDEVDRIMARVIQEATPEERVKLNALDADGRRVLAAEYEAQRKDKRTEEEAPQGNRMLGRKP